jgi:predicted amidohydrolase
MAAPPLRIAAVQFEAVPGDLTGNLVATVGWIERAATQGAGLVLFPEASTTGYDESVFAGPLPSADLAWCAPLQAAVDRTRVVAVLCTPLAHDGRRTLSSVVLRPGHVPVAAYDKQHLDSDEQRFFSHGEHGTTISVQGTDVGVSICYDASFPEHAADAAAAGAHVYVNSGAWFPGGEHRRDLAHAARALDNGMYVAFAGLVGAPHGFIGGSAIFDPEGRLLDQVAPGEQGLAIAGIDLDRICDVRAHRRMWVDRRAGLGQRRHVPEP